MSEPVRLESITVGDHVIYDRQEDLPRGITADFSMPQRVAKGERVTFAGQFEIEMQWREFLILRGQQG